MSTVAVPATERSSRVQTALGLLLRAGVVASAVIVVAGLVIGEARTPGEAFDRRELPALRDGAAGGSHDVSSVLADVVHLRPGGIVTAGLLVLVLTPIARVVVSLMLFALEGDRTFVVITFAVLGMLVASFALGHAGG